MTFGEKLQGLRQKEGMSQDGLAEKLNVSRQAVSRWERDETMPEVDKIVVLADLFEVTTDYLLRPEKSVPEKETEMNTGNTQDWTDKLSYLVKTKGYLLGWVLIVWGATDLLGILATFLLSQVFFLDVSFIYSLFGGEQIAQTATILTRVLWLPLLYGVVKIIAGVLVLKYGRNYAKKAEEEGTK